MFEQVVFAGGGHRCWWQAGFWDEAASAIGLTPRRIAGVSAGAATACMIYANDSRAALDYYDGALRNNSRNAYWGNLWRRGQPVFPHNGIYRAAIRHLLGGDNFHRLLRTAPDIYVQFARLPRWLGPRSAVLVGLTAYNVEKYWKKSLHPVYGRRLGFTPEVVRVQDCRDEDELISLIIASSCTPPFTPIEYRGGRPTLDGGMVDNVPVDAFAGLGDDAPTPTLVLTTRRYAGRPTVFRIGHRTYVQPSVKVPASSWDYTSAHLYRRTYEQGREDGGAFVRHVTMQAGGTGTSKENER